MTRIAILGTFDLENYGDLLFPLLARHELQRRLEDVEILAFSYRRKKAFEWPYPVYSVEEFPQRLPELDAVVVGGGHLVRFDQAVATEYGPPSPNIHHPTGLWLVPPFLAAAAGRAVVWNAVGASPDLADWAVPLFRAALEASAYVSARDRASRATLRTVADRVEIAEVPDTAFGVPELLRDPQVVDTFRQWRENQGLDAPYVVVQGSPKLEPVLDALESELSDLRATGLRIVELPIGPVLGDRTRLIAPGQDEVVRVDPWPHPLLLAQILAHAEAAVGVSLHLGITSLCHGVPVHRPRCWPGSKYEILSDFPGVYQFDENGRPPRPHLGNRVGKGQVSSEVRQRQKLLAQHWDRVAEAVQGSPGCRWSPVARFFHRLPFDLSQGFGAELAAKTLEAELGEERSLRRDAERQHDLISAQLADAEGRWKGLEDQLAGLSSGVAEIASLHQESERRRAELRKTLEDIYRSRAWRASISLRKIYLTLTAPLRRLRRAFAREQHPGP